MANFPFTLLLCTYRLSEASFRKTVHLLIPYLISSSNNYWVCHVSQVLCGSGRAWKIREIVPVLLELASCMKVDIKQIDTQGLYTPAWNEQELARWRGSGKPSRVKACAKAPKKPKPHCLGCWSAQGDWSMVSWSEWSLRGLWGSRRDQRLLLSMLSNN